MAALPGSSVVVASPEAIVRTLPRVLVTLFIGAANPVLATVVVMDRAAAIASVVRYKPCRHCILVKILRHFLCPLPFIVMRRVGLSCYSVRGCRRKALPSARAWSASVRCEMSACGAARSKPWKVPG